MPPTPATPSSLPTDEDDFKSLSTRDTSEIWDKDFSNFAKWMRSTYNKKYPIPVLRKINRDQFMVYVRNLFLNVVAYILLWTYLPNYKLLWGIPFVALTYKYVIQKEEFVHMRAHWPSKMTESDVIDSTIDVSMMVIAGASRESFKRRHVAAHYADIGNIARVFSDVWLPFVTLPAVFYIYPHYILKLAMNKEYCEKERLSRKQLFIETIGLYMYLTMLVVELYHGSYYLLVFHLLPLLTFHGGEVVGAMLTHSGIDRRNSFDSNGVFDENYEGLFGVMVWMVNTFANKFVVNHGIHHAYTQLPLDVINEDYPIINAHILSTYPNVRYNKVLAHKVQKNLLAKLPPPRWYNYGIQVFFNCLVWFDAMLTIMGFPVPPPAVFEWLMVDYRLIFVPKEYRFANLVGFWNTIQLVPRLKEMTHKNAYLDMVFINYTYWKNYSEARGVPATEFKPDDICPPEVFRINVQQSKISSKVE